ncbi:hypothetical protein AOLI_G00004010 [Acnodon oligacanthus]
MLLCAAAPERGRCVCGVRALSAEAWRSQGIWMFFASRRSGRLDDTHSPLPSSCSFGGGGREGGGVASGGPCGDSYFIQIRAGWTVGLMYGGMDGVQLQLRTPQPHFWTSTRFQVRKSARIRSSVWLQ